MKKTIICKDVFGNQYKVPAEDLNIRVGVYAVIIKDNKILLTHQWDGYSLIGGSVEKGEMIEEALVREVKEETGLTIMPDKIIYQATTFFKRDKDAKPNQSVQLYFTHSQLFGELSNRKIAKSEKTYTNDMPEWVSLNDIKNIKFRHSISLQTILKAYKEHCPDGK
ncbi:MAG: NUDIX domain-containing protein [Christensenellaceae bacterium]|jgi:8-oxo-dGTP diphosphatase|nr:NUDIX domain-containing protein [Christensenellaceae bacterium]